MQSLGVDTKIKDKKSGLMKDSVDKKVLASQKNKHPIIKTYIEYTEKQKVVSTYGENWFDYINSKTNRIHSNFTQIMNTGRLSSGQKAKLVKIINQKILLKNLKN